jgi:methylamine dehydrogenase accessory protein MauD
MALMLSQGVLWIVVLALCAIVLALTRQIGVLHARIAPVGALSIGRGPQPGERAPHVIARTLSGVEVSATAPGSRPRLLFFVSTTCPVCKNLVPVAKHVAAADGLDLLLVGDDDSHELGRLAIRFDIAPDRFLNSEDLGRTFHISRLPYAVLLDHTGVIAAQGLVNSREHLESLVVAHERQVHSIQDYLRKGAAS